MEIEIPPLAVRHRTARRRCLPVPGCASFPETVDRLPERLQQRLEDAGEPGSVGGLFAAAERLDLEGVVANRKTDPYPPGRVWYKVKNRAYTQAEGRREPFERRPRSR
jgi:hypothetical protein